MASSRKSPVSNSQQNQSMSSKSEVFRNTTLDSKVRNGMEEMRLAGILCDVTLNVGNVDIQAHKLVLANASHYFYSMFTEGLKETDNSRIVMEGLEPEILTSLVEYSYTNKLIISQDNVFNLYVGSKLLEFGEVTEASIRFLKNQLQPENCLQYMDFAKSHNQSDLFDSYILKNFGEIVKQEDFLKMNKEDLLVFIAGDKIGMESEEQVFDCILSWIHHDRSLRSGVFKDFIKHVRFNNLSSEYLDDKIQNEPLMKEFQELKKDSCTRLGSLSTKPRQYLNVKLMVIGGTDRYNELQSVEGFDIGKNTWSSLCEMPDSRSLCGAAVVKDKVYVVGGKDSNGHSTDSVYMYDPSLDTWTSSIPRMQSQRCDLGVAVLNDRIYAVGGVGSGGFYQDETSDTAEVLDLSQEGTQEWKDIANMNTGRNCVSVGVLNGKIYAVGGFDKDQELLSSVEAYDPETNVWSPVADLSLPRCGAGVGVLDGVLYCVGGSNFNSVEKYSEDTNTWSQVAEMNDSHNLPGVLTHKGRMYVVGGSHGDDYDASSSMEMYDPATNTWSLLAEMTVERIGMAVALIHTPRP